LYQFFKAIEIEILFSTMLCRVLCKAKPPEPETDNRGIELKEGY